MSVKLGIAPIAWSNDDMPELGGDTPLEQCLSEASQAGFIGIESGGKFPKTSEELLPKLNEFKLNLCSGWYGANLRKNSIEEEKQSIQEQLKLFKDCNAPCIVFAEVFGSIQGDPDKKLSTRPKMDLEESKNYYKKISEMGKYLEDEGMPLAYHHHMGTVIESQKDTERLLESTHDSVKLTLDTGHMLFAQGDSKKILNDLKEPKGEYTIVISGNTDQDKPIDLPPPKEIILEFCHLTDKKIVSRRSAIKTLADRYSVSSREIYTLIEKEKK